YRLVRHLTRVHDNVCVVGDEDQSIYSWRGADIQNILSFEKDFPRVRIIKLEQNYRSTKNILAAASAVVAHNEMRKGKTLWTQNPSGHLITYMEATDAEEEAMYVADRILFHQKADPSVRIAVLYRTNFLSRVLEEKLRRYNMKYRIVGGFSFYERAEIKDLVSYLTVSLNPDDSVHLLPLNNMPPRGIENIRELLTAAEESHERGEKLREFLDHAALVSDQDAYDERSPISLMTLHTAKGLEFPVVMITGLEDGLFPHSRSIMEAPQLEE